MGDLIYLIKKLFYDTSKSKIRQPYQITIMLQFTPTNIRQN